PGQLVARGADGPPAPPRLPGNWGPEFGRMTSALLDRHPSSGTMLGRAPPMAGEAEPPPPLVRRLPVGPARPSLAPLSYSWFRTFVLLSDPASVQGGLGSVTSNRPENGSPRKQRRRTEPPCSGPWLREPEGFSSHWEWMRRRSRQCFLHIHDQHDRSRTFNALCREIAPGKCRAGGAWQKLAAA